MVVSGQTSKQAHRILIGWGGLAALVYGLALITFPLLALYDQRHISLSELLPATLLPGLVLCGAALLLMAAYLLGYRALRRAPANARTLALVLLFPLLFTMLLFWVQPVSSVDIYDYLFRGRLLAHYGANPFVAVPEDFAAEPLIKYIGWRKAVTAYGPLWELLSGMAAALAGGNLLRLMLTYKLLAVLSYVLCAWVIWWNWDRRTTVQRLRGLYLWLWNPLVLWELIAGGHNDGWMVLALLVAALALLAGRNRLALFALVAGALVKILPALLIPVALASILRNNRWRGVQQALPGLALGALLAAAAYAPFWAGPATFDNLIKRQPLWYGSPLALARMLAADWTATFVNPWEAWPGGWLTLLMLGLVVAGISLFALRRSLLPPVLLAAAFWLILYLANPWFQPWYLLWIIVLAVCIPERRGMLLTTMVFATTALCSYTFEPFLRPALGWDGESLAWQILYVALVYLPPLLALPFAARLQPALATRRALRPWFNWPQRTQ